MKLDLIIAATMRPNPDLAARLKKSSITPRDLQQARAQAIEGGVINRRISPSELIAYLGQPATTEPDSLKYDLNLWPDHTFEFGVHEAGWVTHNGFALRSDRPTRVPEQVPLSSVLPAFTVGLHTTSEVQLALGPPDTMHGWERMEDWFYRVPQSENHIVLEFDFRLLTGLGRRAPIRM